MIKVNNVSAWAKESKFIVFRVVEGQNWFYDAWNDFEKALKQAVEIGGQVVPVEMVEV